MMIRVMTNRFGTYIKKGNKTIFIKNNSVRQTESSFCYIMENILTDGTGEIPFPSTMMYDNFTALYRSVNIFDREDFAGITSMVSNITLGSVLA